jgi:hypothetical protein
MLRKFAVALLAASVFTAPVFAQGGSTATPPAKSETKSDSAAPKVTANPTLKSAKVKSSKRYARHHTNHVKHVAQAKPVKHVATAHAVRGTKGAKGAKGAKQARHEISATTSGQSSGTAAPKAKSNVN